MTQALDTGLTTEKLAISSIWMHLKLYAHSDGELEDLLKSVKSFSDETGMEFGLDNCAKKTFKRGKLVSTENVVLDDVTVIK